MPAQLVLRHVHLDAAADRVGAAFLHDRLPPPPALRSDAAGDESPHNAADAPDTGRKPLSKAERKRQKRVIMFTCHVRVIWACCSCKQAILCLLLLKRNRTQAKMDCQQHRLVLPLLQLRPAMEGASVWLICIQAGWHDLQLKSAEALKGRARKQKQTKQRQREAPSAAVRLAAPGIARLTADEDGLVVHHCLANRRDLHAEYPPGAAPAAGDAAPRSQGDDADSAEGNRTGPLPPSVKDISRAIARLAQQHPDLLVESSRDQASELSAAEDDDAAAAGTVPGLLRFPWECGPTLEALLHAPTGLQDTTSLDALPPISVKSLPAPEPGCGVRTEEVIEALISEGVLVAA